MFPADYVLSTSYLRGTIATSCFLIGFLQRLQSIQSGTIVHTFSESSAFCAESLGRPQFLAGF